MTKEQEYKKGILLKSRNYIPGICVYQNRAKKIVIPYNEVLILLSHNREYTYKDNVAVLWKQYTICVFDIDFEHEFKIMSK